MLRRPATIAEQVDALLMGADAFDPATGAKLVASHGRRRPGRPARWLVWWEGDPRRPALRLAARTLDEAIDRANRLLARDA